MVCGDVSMSTYKIRHPDDTDDPQDVGLSSDDEATGMREEIGIAQRIAHPVRSVSPPYSQGRAVSPPAEDQTPLSGTSGPSGEPPAGFVRLGPDEVVIKKAVLRGIKRGAELALEGRVPATFSMGASAGMCLLPFPSRARMRSTAPFVERTSPPRPLGGIYVYMRGSQYTSVQGVDGIWQVGPPWRCTSGLVASRTVPTTV